MTRTPPALRIGIDATCWTNWRGFGRFTRSLIRALLDVDHANEYVLFFDSSYERCVDVPAKALHVVVRTSRPQNDALGVDDRRSIRDLWRMRAAVRSQHLDLFFSPSIDSYFSVPRRCPTVVTVHDTAPERLPRLVLPRRAARWRRQLKIRLALRRSVCVVTGSPFMRRQLCDVFGLAVERVGIVPYGADSVFRPPGTRAAARQFVSLHVDQTRPFLLHVCGVGPHKNVPRLLEAFADARRTAPTVDLVLAGGPMAGGTCATPELQSLVTALDLEGRVRFLGHQRDTVLVGLYQAAEAVVVPSLVEGYGLPGVEAVACGTPAIVTRESPLPALLGPAALVIDPLDRRDLARALHAVMGDAARLSALRRSALERSHGFAWEHSARAALTVFDDVTRASARP